jgi:hypothetical protein
MNIVIYSRLSTQLILQHKGFIRHRCRKMLQTSKNANATAKDREWGREREREKSKNARRIPWLDCEKSPFAGLKTARASTVRQLEANGRISRLVESEIMPFQQEKTRAVECGSLFSCQDNRANQVQIVELNTSMYATSSISPAIKAQWRSNPLLHSLRPLLPFYIERRCICQNYPHKYPRNYYQFSILIHLLASWIYPSFFNASTPKP